MSRVVLALFASLLLLLGVHACGTQAGAGGDSESHFLKSCSGSCGSGLQCFCGVCTRPCSSTDDCSSTARTAECVEPEAKSCSSTARMCDVPCTSDAVCQTVHEGFACVLGRCRDADGAAALSSDAGGGKPGDGTKKDAGLSTGVLGVGGRAGVTTTGAGGTTASGAGGTVSTGGTTAAAGSAGSGGAALLSDAGGGKQGDDAKDGSPSTGMMGLGGTGGVITTGAGGTTALGAGGTTPTAGTGGAAGSTGMALLGGDCKSLDFSAYASQPPVSFVNDVLPIFGASCVTSDCHNSAEAVPRAFLQLGHKCNFDMTAKYKCSFPSAPLDPNDLITQPAPNDMATVAAVYKNLVNSPSTTVNGGAMMLVKPGDPANSFLVLKLADLQNSRGLMCTNQDPSHESAPGPCGDFMPLTGDPLCQGNSRYKFDAVVKWIAEGAPLN